MRIFDLKENLERRLDLVAFEYPFYITVNDKADRIYVSDRNRSLTCLLPDGSIVYQYIKKDLPISYTTYTPPPQKKKVVDNGGNMFVAASVVSADGKKIDTVVSA